MTAMHGFRDECLGHFPRALYAAVLGCFSQLPICATVNSSIFCVHGGIPSDLTRLPHLAKPDGRDFDGLVNDLLWSDPSACIAGFRPSDRGCGHIFGPDAAQAFLEETGFDLIVRSHEMCVEGYDRPFGKNGGVLTVFSTCDYCGLKNSAGVVVVGEERTETICFKLLTPEQKASHRIVFPDWLMCHVTAVKIDHAMPALEPVDDFSTLADFP
jgi:diadenosine tetraphosphatase ApaH/serine/threonine PP2A family protein phosphatase